MKPLRRSLRNDHSAVSEVVGTILILGMTVALFSVIVLWVTAIPTPTAGTRVDFQGSLVPIKDNLGQWAGVNITIAHGAGESLGPLDTRVYLVFTKASGARNTEILKLKGTVGYGPNAGTPYGLIDGNDNIWNIGERWSIVNKTVLPTDNVTAEVVDITHSTVLWTQPIQGAAGTHPPIFLEKWADENPDTTTIETPETGEFFTVFARVTDEDADVKAVNATLTVFYGTADPCKNPQAMYDDGTNGDQVAHDGVWTLQRTCMYPTNLTWDNTIILFSATDGKFVTNSRMVLHVVVGPQGENVVPPGNQTFSGRPPNLRYNGLQGYNIFNATEWNAKEFGAKETRTFKANEQVVVVIGSYLLKDAGTSDQYFQWDPYSGSPTKATVYGASKSPTYTTKPSNLQAFRFYKQVNGYNVFIYKYDLNNATGGAGIQYYTSPVHPPYYYYARYSVTMQIIDSYGERFNTTDAINITDLNGNMRQFPLIETFKDSGFTQKTNAFRSTDNIYVAVYMFTVDSTTDNTQFGTVSIRDYLGGTQVQKAFANMRDSNPPLCNKNGACGSPPPHALSSDGTLIAYEFMVNLTLANQDPWVEGTQNYALQISYVHDIDETYSGLAKQIVITAPLYRMDVVGGNGDTTAPAWGSHDYGYFYENLNGIDKWSKTRYEFCGLPGTGNCKGSNTQAVAFLDGEQDGDLDITASVRNGNNQADLNYYRREVDSSGNVIFYKFTLVSFSGNGVFCNKLATGDLTGDNLPEIVCGMTNGILYYFRNDGTWTSGIGPQTQVTVDDTRTSPINGVTIGDFNKDGANDIAVARDDGTVTYYLNLDGLGTFSTGTITSQSFADGEITKVGTLPPSSPPNNYLLTYQKDSPPDTNSEQIREQLWSETSRSGSTTNPGFTTTVTPWTFVKWEDTANVNGQRLNSGGNPGGLVNANLTFHASTTVSGFWYQSFTVSGSTPYSATVNFDRKVLQWMTTGAGTLYVYVFVDPTNGNPNTATAVATYTHTGTSGWTSSGSISVPTSRIPTAGTYYLKIAARITFPATGSGTISTQFDNVQLNWTSTGGQASELKQYWRMQQIPNRPLSSYTLSLYAWHSSGGELDDFDIAYATDVGAGDPDNGTYTTVLTVTATTETLHTYTFTASLQGKTVWIRATDTNHTVGGTNLTSLYVDQMFITTSTSTITPGSNVVLTGANSATSIDSQDANGDGYWDVAVGSGNGRVYYVKGFPGGLSTPAAVWYGPVSGNPTIVGIKFGNITSANGGLEIVIAYGTTIQVIAAGTGSGSSLIATLPTASPALQAITALAVGDINGDGPDDVVVSTQTATNAIVWFRNIRYASGTLWQPINIEPTPPISPGATIYIYDIAIGDGSKSQFMGR